MPKIQLHNSTDCANALTAALPLSRMIGQYSRLEKAGGIMAATFKRHRSELGATLRDLSKVTRFQVRVLLGSGDDAVAAVMQVGNVAKLLLSGKQSARISGFAAVGGKASGKASAAPTIAKANANA